MKRVLVPLAEGSEEIEAVAIIDVLRRAGAEVIVASVEAERAVRCSRGTVILADALLDDCSGERYDLIALPGGMPGAERLAASALLARLLKGQREAGRTIAAICASPAVVLQAQGLLAGRAATCHPSFFDRLDAGTRTEARVAEAPDCVTSRGPGTALEFALKLVERLYGPEKAREIAGPMLVH